MTKHGKQGKESERTCAGAGSYEAIEWSGAVGWTMGDY